MTAMVIRFASTVLLMLAACNSGGSYGPSDPAACPLTDSGQPCTCPGTSVCPAGSSVWFKCLDSGAWEKSDLSCVLGLNCKASADCMSGQACCGEPYTGTWGIQITSSSCEPTPCSSDKVQLCHSSDECVQPGFVCGMPALGVEDSGSVTLCSAQNSH